MTEAMKSRAVVPPADRANSPAHDGRGFFHSRQGVPPAPVAPTAGAALLRTPAPLSEDERALKLGWIAKLNAEELEGWLWALTPGPDGKRPMGREPFDGERAAITKRKQQLGLRA